jgi:hypothetical protein
VLLVGSLGAYLIGFLPTRLQLWRSERQLRRVTEERDALAAARERELTQTPIIPDRPSSATLEDPSDNL